MKKRKLYVLAVVSTVVLIFSLGFSCTFCGTIMQLSKDDKSNSGEVSGTTCTYESINKDKVQSEVSETSAVSESEKEKKIAEEEASKAKEEDISGNNKNLDFTSEATLSYETVVLQDNRFVIIIETMQDRGTEYSYAKGNDPNFYEMEDYFLKFGIPEEQLHIYWGQDDIGGTYDNFVKAVNSVSLLSNKDCSILVALMSHGCEASEDGTPAMIEFADGMGNEHGGNYVSYLEIGYMLDQIACNKMAVIVSSCALTDSVMPLADNPAFPRLAVAPITLQEILNYILTDRNAVDRNKDGMISIQDVYDFVKDPNATYNPARYEGLGLIDYSCIADEIYLN
jgi:DNA-directed RNA polymerase subunit M/transcription elongation factor TFIIS